MSTLRCLATVTILLWMFLFMFPSKAYAYLELGSINFVLQLLMGALIGVSLAIKIYWGRIRTFVHKFLFKTTKSGISVRCGLGQRGGWRFDGEPLRFSQSDTRIRCGVVAGSQVLICEFLKTVPQSLLQEVR